MKTQTRKTFRALVMAIAAEALVFAPLPFPAQNEACAQEKPGSQAGAISFNLKDARISQVAEYLSKQTGWTIIFDKHKDVQAKLDTRINAVSAEPVPVERALDFLNSVLVQHGLSTVKVKDVVIVLTLEDAKKRTFEIHVGSDPEQIPFGDNIVTQIIPLQYSSVTDIKKELEDLVADGGKLLINVRSNSLILIDTATNVRKFCSVINALDKQVSQEILIKPFTLRNADATSVSKVINEIFEEDSQRRDQGSGGIGRFIGRLLGQPEKTDDKLQPVQKVKCSVDDRTNTIIVRAAKDYMTQIEKLVSELDLKPMEIESTMVFHLKNADVTNVTTLLTNLLQNKTTGTARTGGGTGTGGSGGGFPFNWMFGGGGGRGGQQPGGGAGGFSRARAGEGGYDEIVGDVKVQADKDNNSLVVATNPRNFPLLKKLIDELDMVRAQVLIKVFIAEVTLDNETELGMEWSWNDSVQVGDDNGSWSSNTNFGLTGAANNTGFRYQLISENIDVFIRALKRKGKMKVLSAPRILALDNQQAKISVGRQIPRITNTRVTDTGNVINSVQYEDIGISLQVTPHVNPDGLVKMEVMPEVSEMAPESEGVQISEGAMAPVFVTSSAQTTVAVKDGQTVIIGGLIRNKTSSSEYSIPILGDIPLIGALFKSEDFEEVRTELMIFLTPVVVRNSESLKRISEMETEALRLMDRALLDGIVNDGVPLDRVRKKRISEQLE